MSRNPEGRNRAGVPNWRSGQIITLIRTRRGRSGEKTAAGGSDWIENAMVLRRGRSGGRVVGVGGPGS